MGTFSWKCMNGYVFLTIKVLWNLTAGLRFPLSRKCFSTFLYNTVGVIAEEPPAICHYQTEMAWGSRGGGAAPLEAGKVAEVYSEFGIFFFFFIYHFATKKHYSDSKLIIVVTLSVFKDKTSVYSSWCVST